MIDREALREAARRLMQPGITPEHAVVIAYSDLAGKPLDPWAFDDAAIILRAERLLIEGLLVADAVETARAEFVTWNVMPLEGVG